MPQHLPQRLALISSLGLGLGLASVQAGGAAPTASSAFPSAAAAPLVVDRSTYSITFPDGWSVLPFFPANSPTVMLDQGAASASVWMQGDLVSPSQAEMMISARKSLDAMESVFIDSSEKTLGGKTFQIFSWKDDTTRFSSDPDDRRRTYIHHQGNFLFMAELTYEISEAESAVAGFEQVLATLVAKPVSIHRPGPGRRIQAASGHAFDALGRTPGAAARLTAGAYFLPRP